MSHDQGSSTPRELPDLGRPSLFADMAPSDASAPERVRILSTLNHRLPPSKRASRRNSSARTGGSTWQVKALLGLMGLGIGGLLIGFALVVAQGHPDTRTWQHRAQNPEIMETAAVTLPSPQVKATALPGDDAATRTAIVAPSAPPQAAVIENLPVAALLTAAPTVAAAPSPSQPVIHLPPAHAAKVAVVSKASETRPRKSVAKPAPDDDVLLLEAMFAHGKRPSHTHNRRLIP